MVGMRDGLLLHYPCIAIGTYCILQECGALGCEHS